MKEKILTFLVLSVYAYVCGALAGNSFNPMKWHTVLQVTVVSVAIVAPFCIFTIPKRLEDE